jgi:hypothetical protein
MLLLVAPPLLVFGERENRPVRGMPEWHNEVSQLSPASAGEAFPYR